MSNSKIKFTFFFSVQAMAVAAFALLTSCDAQIQDFVNESKGIRLKRPSFDPVTQQSPMSLKLTPGRLNGVASGMAVQGRITATNERFALGSDRAIDLTISRQRVLPQ